MNLTLVDGQEFLKTASRYSMVRDELQRLENAVPFVGRPEKK